jgi:hypothetical protein
MNTKIVYKLTIGVWKNYYTLQILDNNFGWVLQ